MFRKEAAQMIVTISTASTTSYAQKLVTVISSGVFDLLDAVLELYAFDDLGQMA